MNETMNPQPETAKNPTPQAQYADLKYPLISRGIPVPTGLEDYVLSLEARRTLSAQETEEIRAEMKKVFTDAGEQVPKDFDRNFNRLWSEP